MLNPGNQVSTGFSPFQLLYGHHKVRGLLDVLKEAWEGPQPQQHCNVLSYVMRLRDKLDQFQELGNSHLALAQQRQKQGYDKASRRRSFQQGQKVLHLLPTSDISTLAKWQGPYEIIKKKAGLVINAKKCHIAMAEVKYLGYVIGGGSHLSLFTSNNQKKDGGLVGCELVFHPVSHDWLPFPLQPEVGAAAVARILFPMATLEPREIRMASDQLGELGAGAGKGGGGGGSIREAGGALGKRQAAEEERYFRQKEKEQMALLRKHHEEEIDHHKKEIERLQREVDRHKGKIRKLRHDD
ncbi:ATPase inhibitor A, mitochondrial [Merluccius polli]|uniref:ATPase inhibitor A, mitochondrial n=1 Tax=Merluccius polli TaxID=89951 RepID=A0AA47MRV1_MERPO|nr:ATPase inhibitor A, mitochondrial [Merluccius polli]